MFSEKTFETIRDNILNNISTVLDKREGSFTYDMISAISVELAKAYIDMQDILSLGFIEDNFEDYLDKRVAEFGVYRKQGVKATGEILVTGYDGATISNGTIVRVDDLYFTVLNDIVLPDENILYVEANEVGYKYNLIANTEFELVEKDHIITKLVSKEDFKNGVDIESDEDLRERFIKVVNNPSTSGNKAHYEEWALECEGVGRCIVYPLWDKDNGMNGNGTVKVMLIGSDNKPVTEDVIENTRLHIEENMPIGVALTVTTPKLLNILINASIEIKEGYTLDDIKSDFEESLNVYLKDISNELTYSKIYGILASHVGVEDISNLLVNDNNINISISEDKIINISEINLEEVI